MDAFTVSHAGIALRDSWEPAARHYRDIEPSRQHTTNASPAEVHSDSAGRNNRREPDLAPRQE
ncbi:hypothetical protein ACLKOZ_20980 [Arthrobacter sp. R4]|uniref:hypothetical protein n=1 Tax=Arthrobacter sp. R4 TaxID=644417 RepID=UPI003EDACD6D